jgi:hypothetical protein
MPSFRRLVRKLSVASRLAMRSSRPLDVSQAIPLQYEIIAIESDHPRDLCVLYLYITTPHTASLMAFSCPRLMLVESLNLGDPPLR